MSAVEDMTSTLQAPKRTGTTASPAWRLVRLGEIAKARMGKTILSKDLTESGVPVYSAGRENVPWGYIPSSELLFGNETIVIAARGNIGFPRLPLEIPFISTQTTIAISLKDNRHAPYLRYQLETVNWPGMTSQTTIPMVTVKQVENIQIPLPSLDEQKQIVAEIEKQFTRLEAGVTALKRVQANLKRYRAAVLKAACEGKLVPTEAEVQSSEVGGQQSYETGEELLQRILTERRKNWSGRGKYKEPAAPSHSVSGYEPDALPEGWTLATFEQLSERVTVGFVGSMKHEYVPKGIPFLRGQNVRENKFDPEGLLYVTAEFHKKLSKSAIRPGDLAVVRSGNVGVTCVIPETLKEANCSDLVLIQRPLGFLAQYGAYFMNSLAKRNVEAGKVGVALTHFNTKSVAAMSVPLPPLAEQKRIVEEVERRLSVIDELESVVKSNLQRATRLRQSILQKAFTGDLS